MAIIFHCEYCGKKIEAADSAGGKWGKCPSCHNKLYVPNLNPDDEELKLAPKDTLAEEREKQLMAETQRLTRDILREKEVPLGPVDKTMAAKGKTLFNSKCMICHDLKQDKIGPALGNITKIRTPEFIMNLLLNTDQMQKEDHVIKELIKKYRVLMTPPNISKEQARAIVEYLRSVAK